MAKKPKKAGAADSADKVQSNPEISFRDFFDRCVAAGRLNARQEKEIYAFFRDMRLRDKEDPAVFEATLKRY